MDSAKKICEALNIEKQPIGVAFAGEPPGAAPVDGRYGVCNGILRAGEGKLIELTAEKCSCPGGRVHTGLVQERDVPLELLVEGEKLWADVVAAHRASTRSRELAEPPVELADNIFFYPVGQVSLESDLVLFLVDAEQVSRLVSLAQFWDGRTPAFRMHGSLCWSAVTYPLVKGKFNVTAGDISGRRIADWPSDLLIASIPAEQLDQMADAVDKSTAGTAEPSEEFEKLTDSITADDNSINE